MAYTDAQYDALAALTPEFTAANPLSALALAAAAAGVAGGAAAPHDATPAGQALEPASDVWAAPREPPPPPEAAAPEPACGGGGKGRSGAGGA